MLGFSGGCSRFSFGISMGVWDGLFLSLDPDLPDLLYFPANE